MPDTSIDFTSAGDGGQTKPRAVVIHYHLFKNAGSSVDRILQENFPGACAQREFERLPAERRLEATADWIAAERGMIAFSSHSAPLPPPHAPGVTALPVLFLRHPIDRIRSAYDFERHQNAETLGAIIAKKRDFAGYVRDLLDTESDRQCRDFQCERLARACAAAAPERERALRALRLLPFIGLVEAFDASVARLEAYLRPHFPTFRGMAARENAGEAQATLAERLDAARRRLGPALHAELLAANAGDMALFRAACALYGLAPHAVDGEADGSLTHAHEQ